MHATIEVHADRIVFILPLVDDFYGTAGHVAQAASNDQIDMAMAWFGPKIASVTIDVFADRPDVEALFAGKITKRRHGVTWQEL